MIFFCKYAAPPNQNLICSPKMGTHTVSIRIVCDTPGRSDPMKKSSFTDEHISFALQQAETGTPVADIIRKTEISEQAFSRWKKKYAGLLPSELKRLRQPEDENKRLKQMVAELSLDKHML